MVPKSVQNNSGIGTIPSDWRVLSAEEVSLKITKGTTPPKSEISERGDIPFLRVNNLSFNGTLNQASSFIYVSKGSHEKFLSRSMAYPGDVLMNIVGPPLGKTALLDASYQQYNMNQAIVFYRLDLNLVCTEYFLAFLNSYKAQTWLQTRSKKTSGQRNLTIELCKQLPTPVPALPEQRKIAKILQTWDRAIATTEKLIDSSKQQKKALMQQLLTGKKRFAGFEGEWKEIQFGKAFLERLETGFTELPLLSITSEGGVISRGDVGRKDTSNADKNKYKRICPDDIGYNTMRMWQGVSGLSSQEGIISPAYTVVVPTPEIDPVFASYLFKLPSLVNVFKRNSQGLVSDTWNLKYKHFEKIKWSFPSLSEQIKISSVLVDLDKEIGVFQKKLSFLKQEKKALMQQLLTGKRRVKVDAL